MGLRSVEGGSAPRKSGSRMKAIYHCFYWDAVVAQSKGYLKPILNCSEIVPMAFQSTRTQIWLAKENLR